MKILLGTLGFLTVTLGVLGRFKYVWQGNKCRRVKSSKDVSHKFLQLTWIIYIIMFLRNLLLSDWMDSIFWAVGIFTVSYAIYYSYKYSGVTPFRKYLIFSWTDKKEGSWWR